MVSWLGRKMADKVAAAGYLVVIPDCLKGDPFVVKPGASNYLEGIQDWFPHHQPVCDTKRFCKPSHVVRWRMIVIINRWQVSSWLLSHVLCLFIRSIGNALGRSFKSRPVRNVMSRMRKGKYPKHSNSVWNAFYSQNRRFRNFSKGGRTPSWLYLDYMLLGVELVDMSAARV